MQESSLSTRQRHRVSYIEAKIDHVPVLDNVVLSLQTNPGLFLGLVLGAAGNQIIEGQDFSADEALFHV